MRYRSTYTDVTLLGDKLDIKFSLKASVEIKSFLSVQKD